MTEERKQAQPERTPLQKYQRYVGVGGDMDDWPEVDWTTLRGDPPLRPLVGIQRHQGGNRNDRH